MSEQKPVLSNILAMEDDIRTVERIARLMLYLGEREGEIEPDALNALAHPLIDASRDLRAQFEEAAKVASGRQA